MTRDVFMKELEYLLQDIPDEDKADAIAYYRDYLEEAGPENEEKVIRDFGSPERIAAIIRADIYGNLEDGGEFTEKGYDDERFRQPNFQLVKREELPEDREREEAEARQERSSAGAGSGYGSGNPAGNNYGSGNSAGNGYGSGNRTGNGYDTGSGYGSAMEPERASVRPEKRRWEWWQILGMIILACCVVPVLVPLIFGVGGGAIGLIFGLGGAAVAVLVTVSIGLAAVTIVLLLGGILLTIVGFGYISAGLVQGALCIGTGVGIFGLGLLCLSLCGLYYGIFLPWLVKSLVQMVSGILHRKEAAV